MATYHGGAGHPLDKGLAILAEDPEHADINNESTHSSDATFVLGGLEAAGHPEEPVYGNHHKITALKRKINHLCQ